MRRALIVVVVAILVAACDGATPSPPSAQSRAAGQSQGQGSSQAPSAGTGGGGEGAALAAAAAAVTDWCTLMPADLVAELVPGEAVLQAEEFPTRCTASNQVQALQVTFQEFASPEPSEGVTSVPNMGENAWLEVTGLIDDAYLIVILYTDPNAIGSTVLTVEMAGHDGVDHAEDAIAVAQAIIAQLR